jgi:hypothetical protein
MSSIDPGMYFCTSTIAVMTSDCEIILEFRAYLYPGVHLEEKEVPGVVISQEFDRS